MGVPFLFSFLRRRFPDCTWQAPRWNSPVDRVFLDFNCAIHACAKDAVAAQDHQRNTCDVVIDRCVGFVERIYRTFHPRVLLYVAVDGVPPRAKALQQRARRHIACLSKQQTDSTTTDDDDWDSNCVTPGTMFMTRLDAALRDVVDRLSRVGDCRSVEVSGSDRAGEGEQKIIRELARSSVPVEETTVVYGEDADLLLLLLCRPEIGRVVVCRPPLANQRYDDDECWTWVDIERLRHGIHTHLMKCESPGTSSLEFVALSMLLGNDFVPGLACLNIRDGGVDALVRSYHAIRHDDPTSFRLFDAERRQFHVTALRAVVAYIAQAEDVLMTRTDESYYRESSTCLSSASLEVFPRVIRPEIPGWRVRYYSHLWPGGGGNTASVGSERVRRLCDSYLQGLAWSAKYLTHVGDVDAGSCSWTWQYDDDGAFYAPTALDVAHHMAIHHCCDPSFLLPVSVSDPRPLPPDLHLLSVLPAASMHLLEPAVLRDVAHRLELGCVHMYPIRFRVLTYLRRHASECWPVLPRMCVRRLQRGHSNVITESDNGALVM